MALIAGRVRIGKGGWIGANALVSNACRIGDGAKIRIGAVVISDVEKDAELSGNFAIRHRTSLNRYLKDR
jgi:UDP-3-O-[3-hydroxymyristoyl] glucosamine N-acyltransferase